MNTNVLVILRTKTGIYKKNHLQSLKDTLSVISMKLGPEIFIYRGPISKNCLQTLPFTITYLHAYIISKRKKKKLNVNIPALICTLVEEGERFLVLITL